jgi:hypothetical protein
MHADVGHERALEPYQIDTAVSDGSTRPVALTVGFVAAVACVALLNVVLLYLSTGTLLRGADQYGHFAVNLCCAGLAFSQALRVQGPLDYKIGQATRAAIILIGLYALAILSARLFFSRSMLIGTAGATVFFSCFLVWMKHHLSGPRAALIAPLAPGAQQNLPKTAVIHSPTTDLRGFDSALVTLHGPVPVEWARALSRAMLAGCRVRHVGEYVEELRGAVSLDHFELEHLPRNGIASYRPLKRAIDPTFPKWPAA